MSEVKAIETRYKGYRFRSMPLPMDTFRPARKGRHGERYGRLAAETDLGPAGNGYRWWGCVCDCGTKVAVRSRELDKGHTKSCGCLHRESASLRGGRNRLPVGHASRNELLASYKKSARERGFEWAVTDEEFFLLVSSRCVYCGTPPDSVRKPNAGVNGAFLYSGIDRQDNAVGYISGNVVSCCWNCNRAKGTLGIHEFLSWCRRLAAVEAARSARFEHGETPR